MGHAVESQQVSKEFGQDNQTSISKNHGGALTYRIQEFRKKNVSALVRESHSSGSWILAR